MSIISPEPSPSLRDQAALLPLVGVRDMSAQFGFLLRPYWMPGSQLRYRSDCETKMPGIAATDASETVIRTPLLCDADRVLWRQTTVEATHQESFRVVPPQADDILCEYNRSEQTFRTRTILGHDFAPENMDEARITAFLSQPLLTPLLPIPVGFRWHVKSDQGFMDFELLSQDFVGDMPVLTIRRYGIFRTARYYRDGGVHEMPMSVERSGLCRYAWQRSVILDDRTVDLVRCEDADIDRTEVHGTLTLTESRCSGVPKPAPLMRRYQTDSGKRYLYDCGTGHIVEVDKTIDAIADDWRVLTGDEIVQKYGSFGAEAVRTAMSELAELEKQGLFAAHEPRELARVDRISCDGKELGAGEFWQESSGVLILGLTERCNLCCDYCCFGGKFEGQRTHSNRSMDWETARLAIDPFLEGDSVGDGSYPVTFYGGEPLLEFELLRRCVEYAENKAQTLGKKVHFSVTTNGTLLEGETLDFLVAHKFLILISLDGPQEAHDRYRLFANGQGSFETVRRNIERFARRYPDYKLRGFNMTLAPPLDLDAARDFMETHFADYPLSRAGLVNTGSECRFTDRPDSPTRYGCSSKTECRKQGLDIEQDAFRRFEPKDREQLKRYWNEAVASLKAVGATESWKTMPLSMMLFETQIAAYHRRPVTSRAPLWSFFVPCIPGLTRRYCDVEGNYRVCERVDDADACRLGNVHDGLDVRKFDRVMELRRHFGDCGNCEAIKFCDVCYARMPQSDAVDAGFDPKFDLQCQETRRTAMKMLKTYTEIMESNPEALERPMEADNPNFKTIRYGTKAYDGQNEQIQ